MKMGCNPLKIIGSILIMLKEANDKGVYIGCNPLKIIGSILILLRETKDERLSLSCNPLKIIGSILIYIPAHRFTAKEMVVIPLK